MTRTPVCLRFRTAFLLVVAAFVGISSSMFAQTSTAGKVVGTITDQSGAMVPKAEVQLMNVGTNAVQIVSTDDAGGYVFPNVIPGKYKITVKMAGFRTATV